MFMDLGLANRSVIVTGSGSNIGRAIALAFAKEGAKVAVVDIDATRCEKVGEEARRGGAPAVLTVRTDVTAWPDVQTMVQQVETQWGQVDVLVNNVGWTHDRLFMDKPRDEWEKEIQLNLWSNINCTRAVLDGMLRRSAGSIVNIGSDAGRMGEFREAVYGATKAGVIALAKSLSREIGPKGVRFNTICPGTTMPDSDDEIGENSIWAKDMRDWNTSAMRERIAKAYPLRRIGRPDDIANAVLFMASNVSSFITGQTLSVSGGYTMI
jgi:2-hydroxycyclohexanecarboxyl-CoA dehydrogenase